ncbi:YDR387C [Saccharomyces arboricola H-6]|uniref:YDR387C n=1 Tax=Saccharomyces arboricola (strain H-6 / AS 2.3317 / CBS 10644) TaxID=1160507 RepID=J8Q0K9_SACAR|nr:YDR387C [Saccharomyces arboricola H-6]
MSTGENEDVYSDLYSINSQVTSNTANDIEQLPYALTFKTSLIFVGATVGGLLFGYDTGVISGVLLSLKPQDLSLTVLTDFQKELITSSTSIGSFFGSILAFPFADTYGRRITLAICCVTFILAAIGMAAAKTLPFLICGRLLVGVAVGVSAQCVPLFLSEISPFKIRGFMLTLNIIAITGGQLISYIVASLIKDMDNSWRYLFAFSAIPAILFISILDFIPESPRWSISKGDVLYARDSLKMLYPTASTYHINSKIKQLVIELDKLRIYKDASEPLLAQAQSLVRYMNASNSGTVSPPRIKRLSSATDRISNTVPSSSAFLSALRSPVLNSTTTSGKRKRHRMEPRTIRALVVGCVLMFFQQVSGFNAFMYYAAIIFSKFDLKNPLLPAILIASTNFIFTFLAMYTMDSVGRRAILLRTIWIMTVALLLCSIGFDHNQINLLLISVVIFVAAYASAMGSVPWTSIEFLPLNRRSFGASCIACTNWLTNALVSMTYLSAINTIGNENTMLIFAVFTVCSWFFVYFWYPEVKGLPLEEIGKVFDNGIDVHYVFRTYH